MRAAAVLVRHSLGRLRTALVVMAAALALFQVLLAMAAAELQRQRTFEQLASLVPGFVRELVGTALVSMMSFSGIMALGYYHVAIVAVLVGLVVAVATEPAAEVEAGFADLVLAQAVSREAVMTRSVVLVLLCPAIVIAAMTAWARSSASGWRARQRHAVRRRGWCGSLRSSLWSVLACWGGVSLVVGASSRRRAVAAGVAGGDRRPRSCSSTTSRACGSRSAGSRGSRRSTTTTRSTS